MPTRSSSVGPKASPPPPLPDLRLKEHRFALPEAPVGLSREVRKQWQQDTWDQMWERTMSGQPQGGTGEAIPAPCPPYQLLPAKGIDAINVTFAVAWANPLWELAGFTHERERDQAMKALRAVVAALPSTHVNISPQQIEPFDWASFLHLSGSCEKWLRLLYFQAAWLLSVSGLVSWWGPGTVAFLMLLAACSWLLYKQEFDATHWYGYESPMADLGWEVIPPCP
jgi:hypothetical protein